MIWVPKVGPLFEYTITVLLAWTLVAVITVAVNRTPIRRRPARTTTRATAPSFMAAATTIVTAGLDEEDLPRTVQGTRITEL